MAIQPEVAHALRALGETPLTTDNAVVVVKEHAQTGDMTFGDVARTMVKFSVHVHMHEGAEAIQLLEARMGAVAPARTIFAAQSFHTNPFFTGRETLLDELRNALERDQIVALVGLPGMGKTESAAAYVQRFQSSYSAVLWASCASEEALATSLLLFAEAAQLPASAIPHQSKLLQAVQRWFAQHGDWLLVLDNVEAFGLVQQLLQAIAWRKQGHILLTSRLASAAGLAPTLDVPPLDADAGATLLLRRSSLLGLQQVLEPHSPATHQARGLVARLGGHPLAIDQVAAFLDSTGSSLDDYSAHLQQYGIALLEAQASELLLYPFTAPATIRMTLRKVSERHAGADDLLRLIAFLDADNIPEAILQAGLRLLDPTLAADPLRFTELMQALKQYSVVQRRQGVLRIHRLIQEVVRAELDADAERQAAELAVAALSASFPTTIDSTAWPRCVLLSSNAIEHGFGLVRAFELTTPQAAVLLLHTATYLFQRGRFAEATERYERAYAIAAGGAPPDMALLVRILNGHAELCDAQGLFQQCAQLSRQALALQQPGVALAAVDLAQIHYNLGMYAEAVSNFAESIEQYEAALKLQTQALGADQIAVAQTLNNLGKVHDSLGAYAAAERCYTAALEIRVQRTGESSPEVAQSLSNLGLLCYNMGDLQRAEAHCTRAVALWRASLGDVHPDLGYGLNNLALVYHALGRGIEARTLYEEAIRIWEDALDDDHPSLATALMNLSLLLIELEAYDDALDVCTRVADMQRRVFSDSSLEVATTLHNIGWIHQLAGRYAEAGRFYRRVLRLLKQLVGDDHPLEAQCLHNSAGIAHAQGALGQAERLYKRAVTLRKRRLGPSNPNTLLSVHNLAVVYYEQGNLALAERTLGAALPLIEAVFGAKHGLTEQALRNLGQMLRALGMLDEAQKMEARVRASTA
jgi:tetratricopeptide (TPR) repeat protein